MRPIRWPSPLVRGGREEGEAVGGRESLGGCPPLSGRYQTLKRLCRTTFFLPSPLRYFSLFFESLGKGGVKGDAMKKIILALALVLVCSHPAGRRNCHRARRPAHAAAQRPRVIGATPGKPFLWLVPATGRAARLSSLGFAGGSRPGCQDRDRERGGGEGRRVRVELRVTNRLGEARRKVKIVAGAGKLALTPPWAGTPGTPSARW